MDFFDILLAKKLEDDRDPKVEGLSVTANGTYSEDGVVYKPVVVNVPETPLSSLSVTANGTYTAPSGTAYNEVSVNVPAPENALVIKNYESVPTSIASFNDGTSNPLKSLTASIVPVQDLHGYDSPWPAGGGKNKLPATVDGIKSANGGGTWSGNTYTLSGVTFTILTDSAENVTSIKIHGLASEIVDFVPTDGNFTLPANSYILNGCSNGSSSTYRLNLYKVVSGGNELITQSLNGDSPSFTLSGDESLHSHLYISQGVQVDTVIYPMIRLASVTDPTFATYSNICPISGWTEEVVSVVGKNFLPSPKNGTYSGNGIEATVNDGIITITGTTNASGNAITIPLDHPIELKSGMYLHYMNDVVNTSLAPSFELSTDVSGTSLSYNFSSINRITEIPSTLISKKWDRIRFYIANNVNCNCVFSPMLMMSNSASQYEPYAGTTTTIPFTDGQGQSVEVFGGEVDVVNGTSGNENTLGSVNLSDLNWTKQNTSSNNWRFTASQSIQNIKLPTSVASKIDNLCSVYQNITANETWTADKTGIAINTDGTLIICDLNVADTTALNAVIANQTYCYELATPTTFYTQPTSIKSLDGDNNVFASTGDVEELKYFARATS